jgi:hypothetical protein
MESFQSNLIDLQPSFDHIVPKPPDFALGKVQMVKHGVILTHELLEEESCMMEFAAKVKW